MQTLVSPTLDRPEKSAPLCEQVITGTTTGEEEEEQEGRIGTGSQKPGPLQGEPDSSMTDREDETGAEGGGT